MTAGVAAQRKFKGNIEVRLAALVGQEVLVEATQPIPIPVEVGLNGQTQMKLVYGPAGGRLVDFYTLPDGVYVDIVEPGDSEPTLYMLRNMRSLRALEPKDVKQAKPKTGLVGFT